jgi:hypothetical protein
MIEVQSVSEQKSHVEDPQWGWFKGWKPSRERCKNGTQPGISLERRQEIIPPMLIPSSFRPEGQRAEKGGLLDDGDHEPTEPVALVSNDIVMPSIRHHLQKELAKSFDVQILDVCERADGYGILWIDVQTRTTEYRVASGTVLHCIGSRAAFHAEPPWYLRIIIWVVDSPSQDELVLPMGAWSLIVNCQLRANRHTDSVEERYYLFHLLKVNNLSNMYIPQLNGTATGRTAEILLESSAE